MRSRHLTRTASFATMLALAVGGAILIAAPATAATPGDTFVGFSSENNEYAVVSPDGSTVAVSGYQNDAIILIDTATDLATEVAPDIFMISGPNGLAFSPDGSTLYVANYDTAEVLIVDVASATVTGIIDPIEFDGASVLAISGDGETLYVGDYDYDKVYYVTIADGTVAQTVSVAADTSGLYGLYVSVDGARLFAVDDDGSIDVIDVASATLVDTWNTVVLGDSRGGCLSPDGTVLYQPDAINPALYSFSLTTGDLIASNLATVQPDDTPQQSIHTNCAVSPDGASIFLTHPNAVLPSKVTEYDASTLTYIRTYDLPDLDFSQQIVFFSACQGYIVGYDGDAQTFDLDCAAAPPVPELAETGVDAATGMAASFAAVLMLAGVLLFLGRLRRSTLTVDER